VVRDTEGRMVWRAWNFEPDAGEGLNRYIRTSGIRTQHPPLTAKHLPATFHLPEHTLYPHTPAIALAFLLTETYP
jgi:hypothetical protein